MAAVTKLALQQDLNRVTTENAALRAQVHQLEGDLERVTSVASAINTMRVPTRPAFVPPQWQLDRKAAMEAAKRSAMESGRCVQAVQAVQAN